MGGEIKDTGNKSRSTIRLIAEKIKKPAVKKEPLKIQVHYKELELKQKPVGCYIQTIMTKKVEYIHGFDELIKLIYSKKKSDRDAAWAEIKGMSKETKQKFQERKTAVEKAYKAQKEFAKKAGKFVEKIVNREIPFPSTDHSMVLENKSAKSEKHKK